MRCRNKKLATGTTINIPAAAGTTISIPAAGTATDIFTATAGTTINIPSVTGAISNARNRQSDDLPPAIEAQINENGTNNINNQNNDADNQNNTETHFEASGGELDKIRLHIEETAPRGGGSTALERTGQMSPDTEAPEITHTPGDNTATILIKPYDRVFANSALSSFLAQNMLIGNEIIDLSLFPESTDWYHLLDALLEAMYQNPLIMHVESAGTIPGSNLLFIEYRESAQKINEQQYAIRETVPKIIAEIITPSMTDSEKSFAINKYLIENSQYDWDALENAEKNNFQTVDSRFNNSFTAYGILIDKVGVCAGYADAFKILAEEKDMK